MFDDLVILNLHPDCREAIPTAYTNLQWQTCLRRIIFLHKSELSFLPPGEDLQTDHYSGREAYRFLLEVICGLHSPLLGETAVMGQFRKFRISARLAATSWGRFLRKLITDLLVDARSIRQRHLQSLGTLSYGSLVRKQLKKTRTVALLGSGGLAEELLPWLLSEHDVRVFYRSRCKVTRLLERFPSLRLEQFAMAGCEWQNQSAALVIAAPLSASEINNWLELQGVSFSPIFDFRGDARTDPINRAPSVIDLSELFASLRDERSKLEHRVSAIRSEIELIAEFRSKNMKGGPWKCLAPTTV